MRRPGCSITGRGQFSRKLGDHDPAFGINWYESLAYCRWLTTQAQLGESSQCYDAPEPLPKDQEGNPLYDKVYLDRSGFRLPTDAEWEVAGRSGTQTAYSFGNDVQLLGQYGWFSGVSNKWSHPVGQLRPNLRGLFDIHGNVREWVHDRYGTESDGKLVEDPSGPSRGSVRAYRGGGWGDVAAGCRTAYRFGDQPTGRSDLLGFRVAQVPVAGAELQPNRANGAGSGGP